MPKQKLVQEQVSTLGAMTVPDKDIHDTSKALVRTISKSWYQLSKNLVAIYDADLYQEKNFSNFQEYVEQFLGIDYRKAMWRLQQGRAILKHNLTEDQVTRMHETNFKEISSLLAMDVSADEVAKLIELGQTSSFRELQEVVAQLKAKKVGGQKVETVNIQLILTRDAWEVIETGLREASEFVGEDAKIGTKLEYIVHEWTYHHNPELADTIKAKLTSAKKDIPPIKIPRKPRSDKGKKKGG